MRISTEAKDTCKRGKERGEVRAEAGQRSEASRGEEEMRKRRGQEGGGERRGSIGERTWRMPDRVRRQTTP